jgi:ATP-dependent Clp protease ATP-binding subunit ClpA
MTDKGTRNAFTQTKRCWNKNKKPNNKKFLNPNSQSFDPANNYYTSTQHDHKQTPDINKHGKVFSFTMNNSSANSGDFTKVMDLITKKLNDNVEDDKPVTPKVKIENMDWDEIEIQCNNINDLLNISKIYESHMEENKQDKLPPSFQRIYKIRDHLKKINRMVGMKSIKDELTHHIVYIVQDLKDSDSMINTIIRGKSGTGKTELAKIYGDIIIDLGYLNEPQKKEKPQTKNPFMFLALGDNEEQEDDDNSRVKLVNLLELKGQYVGHTTKKVAQLLKNSDGKVLIIDEAYAMIGDGDNKDSFGLEALNIITQYLNTKRNLVVVMIGYDDKMFHLLSSNEGLD